MLTAAARASLRRVAVSLPLRPLTAAPAARAPAVLLARPFSATPRSAEAAPAAKKKAPAKKKPAAKKAAPKKAKKPAARQKPGPKPRERTPEEKEKEEIRALKAAALLKEPAKLPESVWLTFVKQELGGKTGTQISTEVKTAAEKFRALPTSEMERLRSKTDANRATNAANYKAWVESYTPRQIYDANLARRRLARKRPVKGIKVHRQIADARLPKRPVNAFSLFMKEQWAAGVFGGASGVQGAELANQWRALSEAEQKAYKDRAAKDIAEHIQRRNAVLKGGA